MSALHDLSFDFTELFALKKVALQLTEEVIYYKTGVEKNEATINKLLKEKLELQLRLESIEHIRAVHASSDLQSDSEVPLLLKNAAALEESNRQSKFTIQDLQSQVHSLKRDMKSVELQRFQLETQLEDAKGRLELELNCRKEVIERIAATARVLQEIRSHQTKVTCAIEVNEKEEEACSVYRQLDARNKFLESCLAISEKTVVLLRQQSLSIDDMMKSAVQVHSDLGPVKTNDLISSMDAENSKLQQELIIEREKYSELLRSMSTLSELNEKLLLEKEALNHDKKV